MHIILVSDRTATAKAVKLSVFHVVGAVTSVVAVLLLFAFVFSFFTLRHIEQIPLPFVQKTLAALRQQEAQKTQDVVRDDLSAMAAKVGEMQGRVMRLDLLSERLSKLAGIKLQDVQENVGRPATAGRGGPLVPPVDGITESDLRKQIDALSQQVEFRGDYFGLVEDRLVEQKARLSLLPTTAPVDGSWNTSSFGLRRDPFTGQGAMHEGVDFAAGVGVPIVAAAAGMVVTAEYSPSYGNMVEIDHGEGLTTRYGHASRLLVGAGALVKRGQKIAEVGSTGRSTGPHLHFEVRMNGVAEDPGRFLRAAGDGIALAALTK
jgi:murein DD-endopeptidase MepM/ murein hydrolase activator NlpD